LLISKYFLWQYHGLDDLSEREKIERGEHQFRESDSLSIKSDDKEIVQIAQEWEKDYQSYWKTWLDRAKENEQYYLGTQRRQYLSQIDRPLVDNLLFEATETFLPQATGTNPEPVVIGVNDTARVRASMILKEVLEKEADRMMLRMKLKSNTRNWALYAQGVIKVGWDPVIDDIETTVIRPQGFILDKNATIKEGGIYNGEYIGERRTMTAKALKKMVKKVSGSRKAIKKIDEKSGKKDGTKVEFIEWWTNDIVFWTIEDTLLGKIRNPHWNYDDEPGAGRNHFKARMMPYLFMSVFNLGLHPHDDTTLIEQNKSNQDTVVRRQIQIDDNVSKMNNSIAFSGDVLSKEQAARANQMINEGKGVWVPKGKPIQSAIVRFPVPGLPGDVFGNLNDMRNEIRNIYGVAGSSPAGLASENTVRGKILTKESDNSRIGGTITERIEQLADSVYNWWLQLMYVYFDAVNYADYVGEDKTRELFEILNEFNIDGQPAQFIVSVKEGSMIPKDALTKRNEAIDLWAASAVDPLTLMERLDSQDPKEDARKLMLFQSDPQQYMANVLGDVTEVGEEARQVPPTAETQQVGGQIPQQPTQPPNELEQAVNNIS
jgi:hypothetical protein